jgi:hypothetical protein
MSHRLSFARVRKQKCSFPKSKVGCPKTIKCIVPSFVLYGFLLFRKVKCPKSFVPTGFSLVPHCLLVPMSLFKLLGQQLTGPGGDVRVVILGSLS